MKSFNLALNKLSFKNKPAFTIVELLIVIVVIGILASITIVSFSGITNQANKASLQSDLNSNSRKLELYFTQYGSYPTALDGNNCPSAPTVDTNYCLKLSSGTSLTSYSGSSSNFTLKASKGSLAYQISPRSAPIVATLTCPSGFIVVPGSATYGTSDFCVMKYEAKCANNSALSTGITTSANVYDNSAT